MRTGWPARRLRSDSRQAIASPIDLDVLTRYVAPVTEEAAKALFVAFLIFRRAGRFPRRCGSAGFAVGTGFAVFENFGLSPRVGDAPRSCG